MRQFDELVRSKGIGYTSTAALHTAASCHRYLHLVKVPTMFLIAKDDPITHFKVCPKEDLYRNDNFLLAMSDAGGHCEFYYTDEADGNAYKRYTPSVVL